MESNIVDRDIRHYDDESEIPPGGGRPFSERAGEAFGWFLLGALLLPAPVAALAKLAYLMGRWAWHVV